MSAGIPFTDSQLALEPVSRMTLATTDSNWNKSALGARIAYQMGEVKTALVIIENTIKKLKIGCLPNSKFSPHSCTKRAWHFTAAT